MNKFTTNLLNTYCNEMNILIINKKKFTVEAETQFKLILSNYKIRLDIIKKVCDMRIYNLYLDQYFIFKCRLKKLIEKELHIKEEPIKYHILNSIIITSELNIIKIFLRNNHI